MFYDIIETIITLPLLQYHTLLCKCTNYVISILFTLLKSCIIYLRPHTFYSLLVLIIISVIYRTCLYMLLQKLNSEKNKILFVIGVNIIITMVLYLFLKVKAITDGLF